MRRRAKRSLARETLEVSQRLGQGLDNLQEVASDIIEGHLRDVIASMTPEQVMQDKDQLISNMINVCKTDLENIGLEIATMNSTHLRCRRFSRMTLSTGPLRQSVEKNEEV